MARFTLYLNFKDTVVEYPLPAVDNRKIVMDLSSVLHGCRLLFEVYDNIWSIVSNENIRLETASGSFDAHTIADGDMIRAEMENGEKFVILVYEMTSYITAFHKYDISIRDTVTIGSGKQNDICINDRFISSEHAVISHSDGKWVFTDKSLNGSYINGKRINRSLALSVFDTIYTVGFKMVFLGNCIAINRSDIACCSLPVLDCVPKEKPEKNLLAEDVLFSRSPRTIEPLFDETVEIEGPPAPKRLKEQPLIFVVGPSVTMPLPILMSSLISMQSGSGFRWTSIVSIGMSAFIGACWALAHRIYNKKVTLSDEAFRLEAYKEYIRKNDELLSDKHSSNKNILLTQYISSAAIVDKLRTDDRFLWDRNINHADFLVVRIGVGKIPFSAPIAVPKQRFSLYKDDMSELPHKLLDKYKYMSETTALLDLKKHKIVGIIGNDRLADEAAVNIAVQIAALHCYTDVRIAALFRTEEAASFGWLRWLPHVCSEDLKLRMTACDGVSYQNVLYHLNGILRERFESLSETDRDKKRMLPHYVIFCTSETILEGDSIEKYISMSEDLGVTFVLDYKKMDRLPNECNMIIQTDNEFSGLYSLDNKRGETDSIRPDRISSEYAEKFARSISGLRVREFSSGEIPGSIEYFDMIGIGRLEQWNLIRKYKENRVYEGIRSFVGIGIGGKPMYIDIHEKKYGPHGLVAGTTGSGKSETLQTFIISLALNYHPDEVAFILIDYKGGGMANAFIGMPHLAGTITNLGSEGDEGEIDANLTRRALVSIKSEIKRRQAIFNKYKVNHIDLYIRLYREKKAAEPLPHLIIISDEFAELKKEQPEFIKELVSTARVGRSLGIHLILATQKPGGVVDDEIWSNARFKLCLRVQDKLDSIDMLKRPEAASLTQTGRAYLQIGNDEIFEQFQTGYSGAEYEPKDDVSKASGSDISMISIDGTPAVVSDSRRARKTDSVTQLEAAVKFITKVCEENRISRTRSLWLPVLSGSIPLERINTEYNIERSGVTAVIGVIDDPEKQQQYPLTLNVSACSNLIIAGSAGMGKTTMLQTIIMSIIEGYTCEEAVFYLLDFGGRTLKLFNKTPYVGMTAFSDDTEAVERTVKFINSEIEKRKKIFNEANVGSYSEYLHNGRLPLIILIVDNFVSFSETYPNLYDDFLRLTRDCAKYGIQTIITCSHLSDVRFKMRQNFTDVITLVMSERADYSEAWGFMPEFLPENKKGRGLVVNEGRMLEYQTALPADGENETERNKAILQKLDAISGKNTGLAAAERVKVIPKEESFESFADKFASPTLLPVGYNTDDISPCGFDLLSSFCCSVSENGINGIAHLMGGLMYAAKKCGGEVVTVKLKQEIRMPRNRFGTVYTDNNGIYDLLVRLRAMFKERSDDKKAFLAENPDGDYCEYICGKYSKLFVFIDSMSEFLSIIYGSGNKENMYSITETFFKMGAGLGIYFIAGFDSSIYTQGFTQIACRNFAAHKCGIHLGGCLDKQRLFSFNMPSTKMSRPQEYYMGNMGGGRELSVFVPHGSGGDE